MDIKELSIQELESYFNITCKIRDGIIMMARANQDMNNKQVRDINGRYNLIMEELIHRLGKLHKSEENTKPILNEGV